VEKPLLVHQGSYSIPDIVDDAQVEVDRAGAQIAELVDFGSQDADVEATKKQLSQVERAIKDAAGHLKALALKDHGSVKGGKNDSSISYAASRLLTNTAFAITPASEIMDLSAPMQNTVSAVHGFIDAMNAFDLGPGWKGACARALSGTASLLTRFARQEFNMASPVGRGFPHSSRAAEFNMASPIGDAFPDTTGSSMSEGEGSRTPPEKGERQGAKLERHGTREKVADIASNIKDKFGLGGKSTT
ncbi:hypothetical protein FRC01_009343, partial [Tulasnella sp. 417]